MEGRQHWLLFGGADDTSGCLYYWAVLCMVQCALCWRQASKERSEGR